jgi:hypothetical protein
MIVDKTLHEVIVAGPHLESEHNRRRSATSLRLPRQICYGWSVPHRHKRRYCEDIVRDLSAVTAAAEDVEGSSSRCLKTSSPSPPRRLAQFGGATVTCGTLHNSTSPLIEPARPARQGRISPPSSSAADCTHCSCSSISSHCSAVTTVSPEARTCARIRCPRASSASNLAAPPTQKF